MQESILEKAVHLFMRYGVKSVSMDDLARELGISKKTLYQYFDTKETLLLRTLEFNQSCELGEIQKIKSRVDNALQEIVEIAKMVVTQLQQMSPSLIFDLKKYHPEAWRVLENMQLQHIYAVIKENLEKGIAQGLYRNDFDIEVMTRFYLSSFHNLIDEKLFPPVEFPRGKVFQEYIHHYLRGIVSPMGLRYLEKYLP